MLARWCVATSKHICAIFLFAEAGCQSRLVRNLRFEKENGYHIPENETKVAQPLH